MTIYEIKRRTAETSPYFFTRDTMRFFHQTLAMYRVRKLGGKYLISAPMRDHTGRRVGTTRRLFNPENNELEMVKGD
jgi:hypothetical protein